MKKDFKINGLHEEREQHTEKKKVSSTYRLAIHKASNKTTE